MSKTNAAPASANEHVVAAIMATAEQRQIVASEDIVDEHGVKLWSRDQPVSHSLHQRLLERKLRAPIESCLRAEDGVTTAQLVQGLQQFGERRDSVGLLLAPRAGLLLEEVGHLPLHPAVQLLLTTVQTTRPAVYTHALEAMALAGALAAAQGWERYELRLALLGGLLHDLGEMYLDPRYLEDGTAFDAAAYRHVVSHPVVGQQLIQRLTDYPEALGKAISQHHERLDGSGYPSRMAREDLTPLGRLLAVAEVLMGIADAGPAALSRATLALRLVPGEFDVHLVEPIQQAAHGEGADIDREEADGGDAGARAARAALTELAGRLKQARQHAQALAPAGAPPLRPTARQQIAERALQRLRRLEVGGHAIGVWTPPPAEHDPHTEFELRTAAQELRIRLRCIRRECLWLHPQLNEADAHALEPLWQALEYAQQA
ncbi:MAG TPA: HD domain-containing phosphohydrolase [Burkholderiaceae bacterium]|nr:HD domain-containing phosphohydrolase [Burkholderiaceae bacterium]